MGSSLYGHDAKGTRLKPIKPYSSASCYYVLCGVRAKLRLDPSCRKRLKITHIAGLSRSRLTGAPMGKVLT
jgi:hypothetical protein